MINRLLSGTSFVNDFGDRAVSNQWCILTTRMGRDIREPTDADLERALTDVFSGHDPEHPNAWLRLGRDEGPMFVLEVYESRTVLFEQWVDADFDSSLAPKVALTEVHLEVALELWRSLRRGDVDAVRGATSERNERPL
jgi:hypothetical protein